MTNKAVLDLIAAQAKYLAEQAQYMWPDEYRDAISSLKSLMEKL